MRRSGVRFPKAAPKADTQGGTQGDTQGGSSTQGGSIQETNFVSVFNPRGTAWPCDERDKHALRVGEDRGVEPGDPRADEPGADQADVVWPGKVDIGRPSEPMRQHSRHVLVLRPQAL